MSDLQVMRVFIFLGVLATTVNRHRPCGRRETGTAQHALPAVSCWVRDRSFRPFWHYHGIGLPGGERRVWCVSGYTGGGAWQVLVPVSALWPVSQLTGRQ